MELYYVGEQAAQANKFKSLRKQNHKQWEDIQKEDVDIIQGMQSAETLHHIMEETFHL